MSTFRMSDEEFKAWEKERGVRNCPKMTAVKTKAPRPRPRVQHEPGRMNKTESRYGIHLERQKRVDEIIDYKFEHIKFRLADKTFYTPDFFVVGKECIEIHEVKGFWEDDARVKIKVVAEQNPWFKFVAVTEKNGQWHYEEF